MSTARWSSLFLMLPLLIVVFPISFSSSPYLQFPPPGWSLRWYVAYFDDPVWIDATIRSLKVAPCDDARCRPCSARCWRSASCAAAIPGKRC